MIKMMKNLLAGLLFLLPFTGFAQLSVVGDWTASDKDENGNVLTFKVSMKANGTYAVDLGVDGTIEIEGKYSIEGDTMTIEDVSGPAACKDGKGVYKFVLTETTNSLTMVSDPCGHAGPTGKTFFTRVK